MKITLTREALRTGLDAVNSVIPSRTTLPVLSNVLIETTDNGMLRFAGSDLDVTAKIVVPAQIHEQGALTLPARKLSEIARELGNGEIKLTTVGDAAQIESGRSRFRLNGLSANEFPNSPEMDWNAGADVSGAVLKELISHTSFAVSTEETRPILNGVLWEINDHDMRMVATNGHRLAKIIHHSNGSTPAHKGNRIVHPRALSRVEKLFEADAMVQVVFQDNHVGFRNEDTEIFARLIDGPYPNYEQVIPKDNDKELLVDKQALLGAIRRMSIVASDQTHRVRWSLGGPMMRFSVQTPDLGEATEELAVDYAGEPLEIGFNANYVLEVLKYVPSERVKLTFKGPERAAVVLPADDGSEMPNVEFLLMPLRLLD